MAIRVRKLSRQLRREPEEVLEWLASLGFERYRGADDMLPEHAAEAVRDIARRTPHSRHAALARPAPRPSASLPSRAGGGADLMAALVPGVAPLGASAPPARSPVSPPRAHRPPPGEASTPPDAGGGPAEAGSVAEGGPRSVPSSESGPAAVEPSAAQASEGPAALRPAVDPAEWPSAAFEASAARAERAALARARAEVEAERAALAEERAELERWRMEMGRERAILHHDKARLSDERRALQAREPDSATHLSWLLTQRGLRGMDEFERALVALGEQRQLRHFLDQLRVDDPQRVTDVLQQRLVLTGGEIPDGLPATLGAVTVAPSRADVPGKLHLERALARFGEILLLHGLRRITVVGGRPQWHKVLREGLDPRVDLRFAAQGADLAEVLTSAGRGDLVLLWDAQVAAPADSRAAWLSVSGDHLLTLVAAVEEFLRRGAA